MNKEEINKCDANLIGRNSLHGYLWEASLEYPNEVHSACNDDYPLLPEKLEIGYNVINVAKVFQQYCRSIW